jgi:hypothetical protein
MSLCVRGWRIWRNILGLEIVEVNRNMSCLTKSEEGTGQLLEYCAGQLGNEASAEIALHLKSCPECARVCSAQASVWQALDFWQAAPASQDFNRRLFARIEAENTAPWWQRELHRLETAVGEFIRPILAQPALPLSAAALVIVAGFVLDHPAKLYNPFAAGTVRGSGIELEKVEANLEDMEMLRQFDVNVEEQETTGKTM